jgi:hypothetical protein
LGEVGRRQYRRTIFLFYRFAAAASHCRPIRNPSSARPEARAKNTAVVKAKLLFYTIARAVFKAIRPISVQKPRPLLVAWSERKKNYGAAK